jgi:hypothetical protein
MKGIRVRCLLSATIVASFLLGPSARAFATEPRVLTFHNEGSVIAADCGTFLARSDFVVDYWITTFFDEAGNAVRIQAHINFDGTLTNSATGLALHDPSHYLFVWDLVGGSTRDIGLVYGIVVPGQGPAVLDAGKLVWDVDDNVTFVAGLHQFLDGGLPLICRALG